jgi:hypothetical protein
VSQATRSLFRLGNQRKTSISGGQARQAFQGGGDRQQAVSGGLRARPGQHRSGGVQVASDHGRDVLPVAKAVRRQSGGLGQAPDALQTENARLKRLLADAELDKAFLSEATNSAGPSSSFSCAPLDPSVENASHCLRIFPRKPVSVTARCLELLTAAVLGRHGQQRWPPHLQAFLGSLAISNGAEMTHSRTSR